MNPRHSIHKTKFDQKVLLMNGNIKNDLKQNVVPIWHSPYQRIWSWTWFTIKHNTCQTIKKHLSAKNHFIISITANIIQSCLSPIPKKVVVSFSKVPPSPSNPNWKHQSNPKKNKLNIPISLSPILKKGKRLFWSCRRLKICSVSKQPLSYFVLSALASVLGAQLWDTFGSSLRDLFLICFGKHTGQPPSQQGQCKLGPPCHISEVQADGLLWQDPMWNISGYKPWAKMLILSKSKI